MAYADDLAITGNGRCNIRRAIKIVEGWTVKAKMRINKNKSGIMIMKKRAGRRRKGEQEDDIKDKNI